MLLASAAQNARVDARGLRALKPTYFQWLMKFFCHIWCCKYSWLLDCGHRNAMIREPSYTSYVKCERKLGFWLILKAPDESMGGTTGGWGYIPPMDNGRGTEDNIHCNSDCMVLIIVKVILVNKLINITFTTHLSYNSFSTR